MTGNDPTATILDAPARGPRTPRTVSIELLELLRERGVRESAARLYLSSLSRPAQSAPELARGCGMHRVEAYRVAEELVRLRYFTRIEGYPTLFAPTAVEEVIRDWTQQLKGRIRSLKATARRLEIETMDAVTTAPLPDLPVPSEVIAGVAGRQEIALRISHARRRVIGQLSPSALSWAASEEFATAFGGFAGNPRQIALTAHITPESVELARALPEPIHLYHSLAPILSSAFLVDNDWAAVGLFPVDPNESADREELALCSVERSFIRAVSSKLGVTIRHSVPASQRFHALNVGPGSASTPRTDRSNQGEICQRSRGARGTATMKPLYLLPE
jgi:hypothetical protein